VLHSSAADISEMGEEEDFEVESADGWQGGGLDGGPAVVIDGGDEGGGFELEETVDGADGGGFDLEETVEGDEDEDEDEDEASGRGLRAAGGQGVVVRGGSSGPGGLDRSLASEVDESAEEAGAPAGGAEGRDPLSWPPLPAGAAVEALYGARHGGGDWYGGRLGRRHADGTYTVHYDDGDEEDGVSPWHVRLVGGGGKGGGGAAAGAAEAAPSSPGWRSGGRQLAAAASSVSMVSEAGEDGDSSAMMASPGLPASSPTHGRVTSLEELQRTAGGGASSPPMTVRTMSAGGYSEDFEEEDAEDDDDEDEEAGGDARGGSDGLRAPTRHQPPVRGVAAAHRPSSRSLNASQASGAGYSTDFEQDEEDEEDDEGARPAAKQAGAGRPSGRAPPPPGPAPTRPSDTSEGRRITARARRTSRPGAHRTADASTQTDAATQTPQAWSQAPIPPQQHWQPYAPHPWSQPPPGPPAVPPHWAPAFSAPVPSGVWPSAPYGMSPAGSAAYLRALAQAVAEAGAGGGAEAAAPGLAHTAVFRRQLQLLRSQVDSIRATRTSAARDFARPPRHEPAAAPHPPTVGASRY